MEHEYLFYICAFLSCIQTYLRSIKQHFLLCKQEYYFFYHLNPWDVGGRCVLGRYTRYLRFHAVLTNFYQDRDLGVPCFIAVVQLTSSWLNRGQYKGCQRSPLGPPCDHPGDPKTHIITGVQKANPCNIKLIGTPRAETPLSSIFFYTFPQWKNVNPPLGY